MSTMAMLVAVLGATALEGGRAEALDRNGSERIERLIDQLDSSSFAERDKAMKELEAIGPQALPALRKALKASPTPEALRRIRALVRKLEEQELTAKLLAPRRVRLAVKEAGSPTPWPSWPGRAATRSTCPRRPPSRSGR